MRLDRAQKEKLHYPMPGIGRLAMLRILKDGIGRVSEKLEKATDENLRRELIVLRDRYVHDYKHIRREILTEEYI